MQACLLVGIVIPTGATYALGKAMEMPYAFDLLINVQSFVFSAGLGVVFGYCPAR